MSIPSSHRPLPRILCIVGTRPEGIKMAPLVLELRKYSDQCETVLVSTGQHREMLAQALEPFDLIPEIDLGLMQAGQTLAQISSRAIEGLDRVLEEQNPQWVVGQGDTTTVLTAALASFYRHVPFAHLEAGLRTSTIDLPFPEEFNRRAVSLITRHHFAPTALAQENLLSEGHDPKTITLTGNTGVDAVLHCASRLTAGPRADADAPMILITTHRRENWGEPQTRIAQAVLDILEAVPKATAIVAMHRNPQVRSTLRAVLGGHARVALIEPPAYFDFVAYMKRSTLILTDSGGVQEDAPAFGIPVLVLREETERPEGVEAGAAKLVGTDRPLIVKEAVRLLTDTDAYAAMSVERSPYGDGRASERVRHRLLADLGIDTPNPDSSPESISGATA